MRVLVIQLRRLGDILMTTPLVRALETAWPTAGIHYCVARECREAIRGNPRIDTLVVAGDLSFVRLVRTLRHAQYDVAIDCHGTPATARLAFLSGARMRIGQDRRWRRMWYTHPVRPAGRPLYSALDKLALLEPLGIRDTDCRIEIVPTADERAEADAFWRTIGPRGGEPVVAWSPVSRRPYKAWPVERHAAACDAVFERTGARFLPLFAPGEEAAVERAIRCARHRGAFIYPHPMLSFGALKPVLERCAYYFGNDNGARHVAVAAGIPTAAVFGPADPACWTPPGESQHLTAGGRRPITEVSTSEVIDMLVRLSPADLLAGQLPSAAGPASPTPSPR